MADKTFTYSYCPIGDLHVTEGIGSNGRATVTDVAIDNESFAPTERFWTSLFSRFGISRSIFKYYSYAEVFERISGRERDDRLRVCVERDSGGKQKPKLLAATNPTKPICDYDNLMKLLSSVGIKQSDIRYANGIVESIHTPRIGGSPFQIGSDEFRNRFMISTAIDGYGKPIIYLGLEREIAGGGAATMFAMSKHFRTEIGIGKGDDNVEFAMTRALDQFNNDEGFTALRKRIHSALNSMASVYESSELYKLVVRIHNNKQLKWYKNKLEEMPFVKELVQRRDTDHARRVASTTEADPDVVSSPVLTAFHEMTGDTSKLYGLANLDALSAKRQRTLPVRCTVYDLINFATEISCHCVNPEWTRTFNTWIGKIVSGEYDLEGTAQDLNDFDQFFAEQRIKAGVTGSGENITRAAG